MWVSLDNGFVDFWFVACEKNELVGASEAVSLLALSKWRVGRLLLLLSFFASERVRTTEPKTTLLLIISAALSVG